MFRLSRAAALTVLGATLTTACSIGDVELRRVSSSPEPVQVTSTPPPPSPSATPKPLRQLPRGGRTIFPKHTVVAYYGTARTAALGVLGEGTPAQAATRLEKAAAPFGPASGTTVLPAFELVTTVAEAGPGKEGQYTSYLDPGDVQRYLLEARRRKMLLLLDFQPGRADFLDQVKRYERFLLQPEVGVALDPEWKLYGNQRHLRQIGTTDATQINRVSSYLANLTLKNRLPEKLFVIHQFKVFMIRDRDKVVDRPGLATVLHVDGFGTQGEKKETYGILASRNGQFVNGFKLFYDEDTDLMTPAEAMALRPRPMLISYQ